ncbi:MAG: prepilin peptidase [Elusimicrobia bacterium]|nr:prepilin peptidase [Elusimicrobiota bacterium]
MEIFIFILGTFFGSFANVCIKRIPYGNSIVKPSSHCPKCLVPIKWKDNFPIISFLILKGKCRNCHADISFEYPMVELLTGLYFLGAYIYFGFSSAFFISILLGLYLIIISFVDIHLKIIPNILSVSLLIIGLILSPFNTVVINPLSSVIDRIIGSVLGALSGGILLYLIALAGSKIYKKEVMGGGDIKLIAAGGSFLGIYNIFSALILACFIGGIVGLIFVILKKQKLSDFVPFGPYLSASILIVFFIQPCLFPFC